MININNSKISTKSAKHCNSNKFGTLVNVLQNVFFFFTNFSQENFLFCKNFLMLMKTLYTASTPTEVKQNLLHLIFLLRFLLVLLSNISLDEHSLLLSHIKAVVCSDDRE